MITKGNHPLKPKRLSLFEMWQLYNVLKSGIRTNQDAYLIDEVLFLMQNNNSKTIKKSLQIMYDKIEFNNPLDVALLFSQGIIKNDFFSFVSFVEGLHGK